MSAEHDRKFFDTFMLILGILAAITIGLMVLAGMISDRTSKQFHDEDPRKVEETLARIAPVGRVAVAGQDNSALAPPAAAPTAAAVDLPGEQVYQQVCTACHGAAVAGAPKTGDKAAWAPRIAQGMDLLHKHALEGFQGKAGYMPPKGGRTDLSDQSVMNAVDYLVSQAQVSRCLRVSSVPVVVATAVAGFVAGCASPPPKPDTMRDPSVNFSNFKTFGWTAGGTVDAGDAPLKLLDANIRAAIVDVMKRKGYVEAPAGTTPDLRIAYETARAEKLENNPGARRHRRRQLGRQHGRLGQHGQPERPQLHRRHARRARHRHGPQCRSLAGPRVRQDDEGQRRTGGHQPGRRAGDGGFPVR